VTTRPKILGQLLVETTDLDQQTVHGALAEQRSTGLRIAVCARSPGTKP